MAKDNVWWTKTTRDSNPNTRVGHIKFTSANSRYRLKNYIFRLCWEAEGSFGVVTIGSIAWDQYGCREEAKVLRQASYTWTAANSKPKAVTKEDGLLERKKDFWKNLGSTTTPRDYVLAKRLILNELLHSEVGTTLFAITNQTAVFEWLFWKLRWDRMQELLDLSYPVLSLISLPTWSPKIWVDANASEFCEESSSFCCCTKCTRFYASLAKNLWRQPCAPGSTKWRR